MLLCSPLFAFASGVSGPPINIICGKDNYILYESVNYQHAAIKNGVLMSDTKGFSNPYEDDENAIIFEFDEWGQNGGIHVHHFLVFNTIHKTMTLQKRTLDADNLPRGDGTTEKCKLKK